MKKWALIADVAKCTNCGNCVLAAKDEHIGNDFPGYAAPQPAQGHEWISVESRTRGSGTVVDVAYIPKMCNHCDDAPCIKAAGDGSVYKRADGIVIIDPVKAQGRKDLVAACPYGSIAWNDAAQLPQIWIFDAHLLDAGWDKPRCVQVCPTGALQAVKVSDEALRDLSAQQGLEPLRPELGTAPRVLYRNLQRATSCFLAGNVCAAGKDGRLNNVEGAHVEFSLTGQEAVTRVETDHFGDFRIDGLPGRGLSYSLRISDDDRNEARLTGVLHESVNLGSIALPAHP